MRVRKVDNNQKKLVEQMRAIPGVMVRHTHTVGCGFPDIVVGYKGQNYLFEIKDPTKPPSGRKLTLEERWFHDDWTGQITTIQTIDDVLSILKITDAK
jgi:hypothetical protein